jgi:hypothetical protein
LASRDAFLAYSRVNWAWTFTRITRLPKIRCLLFPPMTALQRALRASAMPLGFDTRSGLAIPGFGQMCNLYSITTNQDAIRRLFKAMNSRLGNLPPMPGVFPDYSAMPTASAS